MSKQSTAKVVTANDLFLGDVVWRTAMGTWSNRLADAEVLSDPEVASDQLAKATAEAGQVVGAYLAEVSIGASGPEPVHFREAFRTRGPSNYPHGKQEEA